ncbi:uncharacterized protein BP5553_09972 [Venustampulla echinocandica]|uniref:Uncharacterized protein n=1 Tax=Venustampulla echinocandica TaxID=2656787 RepID=A0A370TB70_9HELO|nr:uncharacterized protein BP5553_09972 [Venustampulla echinocandica]RDL31183.1 hypothetical protein BP5553_09972 [Venustampulla echinocandica]
MVLKRKRSDSEISTSSSLLSSSSPLGGSSFMAIDNLQSHQNQNQIATPSLFSSRTRKRHRDNRPSESDVHRMMPPLIHASVVLIALLEHTLSLLFSAQQNTQPPAQTSPQMQFAPQAPVAAVPASNSQSGHQSSLHSFWALPSSARQSSPGNNSAASSSNTPLTMFAKSSFFEATNCEDCDSPLNQGDSFDSVDMDVMMDIDMHNGSGPSYACAACSRQLWLYLVAPGKFGTGLGKALQKPLFENGTFEASKRAGYRVVGGGEGVRNKCVLAQATV